MEMALPSIWKQIRRAYGAVSTVASAAMKSPVVGAIALALLTTALTYMVTARLNTESAVQQQQLAAIQTFISSGADVDTSITNLSDAAASGQGVDEAKREARRALSAHAAAGLSIEPIVGKENLKAYMVGVGTLRELVRNVRAGDGQSAMDASQARFDVMHNRTQIIAEARKNIYS